MPRTFWSRLFSQKSSGTSRGNRRQTFQPRVETMEERALLAAMTATGDLAKDDASVLVAGSSAKGNASTVSADKLDTHKSTTGSIMSPLNSKTAADVNSAAKTGQVAAGAKETPHNPAAKDATMDQPGDSKNSAGGSKAGTTIDPATSKVGGAKSGANLAAKDKAVGSKLGGESPTDKQGATNDAALLDVLAALQLAAVQAAR